MRFPIENFFPVPWLRLESKISANLQFEKKSQLDNEIDSGDYHRTLFSLMPYQKVRRRQSLTCTKRGYYRFETVSLTTGDAFGISDSFKSVQSAAEITVYPQLVAMEDIPLPAHSWLGDMIVRRWIIEDPFLVSGVRDYSYGDSMNSINWKATARTNRMQVSKKDFSADHNLMIYINFNQTTDIWMPIIDEQTLGKSTYHTRLQLPSIQLPMESVPVLAVIHIWMKKIKSLSELSRKLASNNCSIFLTRSQEHM